MSKKIISYVIPCYNEEAVLPELFKRLNDELAKINYDYEVILIDDGSSDKTLDIIKAKCLKNKKYKFIKLSRNFGHQIAITVGIKLSQGNAVIVLDADLQDPPDVVGLLIKEWEKGHLVVHAVRSTREWDSKFKVITAKLFYKIISIISDTEIIENSGDFKLYDRKIVNIINDLEESHRFIRGIASWVGFKQSVIYFSRKKRFAGETKYTLKKMINLSLDAVMSFSDWPMRFTCKLGFLVSTISFILLSVLVIDRLLGNRYFPGWLSIIGSISLLNGILMMMTGIQGLYIGKIFQEVKKRPLYIIEDLSTNIKD